MLFIAALVACGGSQTNTPPPRSEPTAPARADAKPQSIAAVPNALTNARVEDHFRSIAIEMPRGETADRIAFGIAVYPANAEENRAMAGFTLLFVAAVARDPKELPLERVFFRDEKHTFDIPPLMERVGSVEPEDIRAAFGATRSDGLYAIPLDMTRMTGALMADFRLGHRDVELMLLPLDQDLPTGVEPIPPGTPNAPALEAFARREFPVILERGL